MDSVIITLVKANILSLIIIIASYIIEKVTELRLFIDNYFWPKSLNNAKILSNRDQGFYVILNISVYIYDIYNNNITFNVWTFILWIIILLTLAHFFHKIHYKYQAVDPNKADDDYS